MLYILAHCYFVYYTCCIVCLLLCCVQNLCSGTTIVVGIVTDSHLHMGWTGGSQVVLVRRGVSVFASQPHKPERATRKAVWLLYKGSNYTEEVGMSD